MIDSGDQVEGPEADVHLVLQGRLSFEEEISLHQAAQIIAYVSGGVGAAALSAPAPVPTTAVRTSPEGRLSPLDTLTAAGAQTNAERIVAFAALVQDDGKQSFRAEDIKPLFRRARQPTPANFSRDMDGAIRAGWITEADVSGEFYLTSQGYDAIDDGFHAARSRRTGPSTSRSSASRSTAARRPKRTTTAVPEAFADLDVIPNSIPDAPTFTALRSDQDRFLWALALARHLNIDGLENKDVVWITDALNHGIPTKQITSKYQAAATKGHANKSIRTGKMRLSEEGAAHLLALASDK